MADKTVWVLTREINAHDQEGAYFVAVFERKPTIKSLAGVMAGENGTFANVMAGIEFLEHLLSGGGRSGTEHEWYNLEEAPLRQ